MNSKVYVGQNSPVANAKAGHFSSASTRLDDAIYQNGQPVARALEAEVDLEAKEIRFGELYDSDRLLLPDECEYQKFTILIRKITFASRLDKDAPHKGRVLRGIVAEILGFREP